MTPTPLSVVQSLPQSSFVSFDVFDTAIFRLVPQPTDVFDLVQARFEEERGEKLLFSYRPVRVAAERHARKVTRNDEVTLEQIFWSLAQQTECEQLDSADFELLKTIEVDIELAIVRPNPEVLNSYRLAKTRGLSPIFISDMYLPKSVISRMLAHCGYNDPEVFVSNDCEASKHSGSLFLYVLDRLGIGGENLTHFGDNHHSDYVQARQHGINAIHLETKKSTVQSARTPTQHLLEGMKKFYRGTILSDLSESQIFWREFGYGVGGPLLFGFVSWLIESLRISGVSTVCFLARDGYIMKAIYDRMAMRTSDLPPSRYLYASRRALCVPAFTAFDHATLELFSGGDLGTPIRHFLERLGLDVGGVRVRRAMALHGIRENQVLKHEFERRFVKAILRTLEPDLQAIARLERDTIMSYFGSIGITEPGHIAIVDIGWHGTMQEYIRRIFDKEGVTTAISGYYVATFPPAEERVHSSGEMQGYVAQFGQPRIHYETIRLCVEVFELLCSAPHGSVLGVKDENNEWIPICDSPEWEDSRIETSTLIHQGILDFVDSALELSNRNFPLSLDLEEVMAPIHRILSNPTHEEVKALGSVRHDPWFGKSYRGAPLIPSVPANVFSRLLSKIYPPATRKVFWPSGESARSRFSI